MKSQISQSLAAAFPVVLVLTTAAVAQAAEPKFEYSKPEEVSGVEWAAQAKAGALFTAGNSQSVSVTGGLAGSRKSHDNRFSAEANVAYLRSSVLVADDANGSGAIDPGEISRVAQTTSQSWLIKGRYDRYFAETNSVFVALSAASDVPAGKRLIGGGQLGYARHLYKTDRSETSVEAGYDFSYEDYIGVDTAAAIHSARLALINATRIGEKSAFTLEAEALANLNRETAPNTDGAPTVGAFQDLRANVTATLTSPLTDRLSLGVSVKLRYDRVPAPRPPFKLPYAPGFMPLADSLDTIGEASLIYTLL